MNQYNHALLPLLVLLGLFMDSQSVYAIEILLFSIVFGSCIDLNQKVGKKLGRPSHHLRTFVEEPFGVLLIGLPAALLLALIKIEYFVLVIVPYAMHVLLDYITIHRVSPMAPFSGRVVCVGVIVPSTRGGWPAQSEKWITVAAAPMAILAFVAKIVLTHWF